MEELGLKKQKESIGISIAGILFSFEVFGVLCNIFSASWKMFASFPTLLDEATVFLNIICIGFLLYGIVNKYKNVLFYVLYIANLILVNHLYSNQTWFSMGNYIKELITNNWKAAAGIIVAMILVIWVVIILIQIYKEHKNGNSKEGVSVPVQTQTEVKHTIETEQKLENDLNNKRDDSSVKTDKVKQSEENHTNRETVKLPIMARILIRALECIVMCAAIFLIIDYVVYDKLELEFERAAFVEQHLNLFRGIGIVAIVVIIATLLLKLIKKQEWREHSSAVFAIIIELIFIYCMKDIIKADFSGQFLEALSENVFAILLIIVIMFLVIHISLIIVGHFFLGGTYDDKVMEISGTISEGVNKLEKKLVKFAFDILYGILNLFCFIPDFFNTIGYTLLEENEMFSMPKDNPGDNRDLKENEKS